MKNPLSITAFMAFATLATAATATEVSIGGVDKVKLGGRIQYDYNRAERNGTVDEDTIALRRGRLALSGDISERYSFKVQFNVNGGGVEDMYLRHRLGGGATLTIGNQLMPFGLEQLTSSKDISILERSALSERYALGRKESLVWARKGAGRTLALGIFRDGDAGDRGLSARATRAFRGARGLLHLGLGYRSTAQHQADPDGVDMDAYMLELGLARGPVHLQAEIVSATENEVDREGYYVQLGWILSGESRPYKDGVFKRVAPSGEGPAWELMLRLEDGDGDYGDIELGATDASAMGIGINVYPHKNARLGLNYTTGEDFAGNEGSELRLRAQLTF